MLKITCHANKTRACDQVTTLASKFEMYFLVQISITRPDPVIEKNFFYLNNVPWAIIRKTNVLTSI